MQQKAALIIQRYNAASTWTSNNPILLNGELGIEFDTNKVKVGDGVTSWNSLGYCIAMNDFPAYIAGNGVLINQNNVISARLRYEVIGEINESI